MLSLRLPYQTLALEAYRASALANGPLDNSPFGRPLLSAPVTDQRLRVLSRDQRRGSAGIRHSVHDLAAD